MAFLVTLVTTDGCHYCARAKELLVQLQREWPLEVAEVPLHSAEGTRLALRDGIAFPPGIYLNGAFFGYGRLSEGKLRQRLAELRTT